MIVDSPAAYSNLMFRIEERCKAVCGRMQGPGEAQVEKHRAESIVRRIEFRKNSMYHWRCRRFCSVVRLSRETAGDVTEEMSGPKPTFYFL